jgi:hypothetical protein
VHGGKFWSDGLRQHGDGIRVLGYAVKSPRQLTTRSSTSPQEAWVWWSKTAGRVQREGAELHI